MQQRFLNRIGSFEPFKLLFDLLPNVGFYMKDLSGRIMVINRYNCANNNISNEMDAIGKTSHDLFKPFFADAYYNTDAEVMKTGRPLLNKVTPTFNCLMKPKITNRVPLYDKNHKIMGVAMAYYSVDSAAASPTWSQRFAIVIDYIHTHYAEQVKSEKLAKLAQVSETHLKRTFNQIFGMPPIEYVILTRINAARELLDTTDRTVSDIAQAVGFYDHSHLIRHFKRLRGCTPNQYRKQVESREQTEKKARKRSGVPC